ncbi:hypothetical protein L0Y65_06750 [Candidatus Micrarchaeota archaeon]|nr:hypothetical protein [Candidatus Micrarchaeota archaeon]
MVQATRYPEEAQTSSSIILESLKQAGYGVAQSEMMLSIAQMFRNPSASEPERGVLMRAYMNSSLRMGADVCRMANVWKSVAPNARSADDLRPEQARQIAATITSPPANPVWEHLVDGAREMYRYFSGETTVPRAPRRFGNE